MPRSPLAAVAAAALLIALLPASASAKGFTYSVTAGEVTSSSAVLWTRSDKSGTVRLTVSRDKSFGGKDPRFDLKATSSHDNTVQRKVTKLLPGTVYYYRFSLGSNRSDIGRFKTAPTAARVQTITFGLTGDADAVPTTGQTKAYWNNFEVYREMAEEGNDFNINLGDTIYSDSEVPGRGELAESLAAKWLKYKTNIGMPNLQVARRSTGFYSHWDDHEFRNDFSKPEFGSAIYKAGVQAFRDFAPVTYDSKRGIYRKFRWGKNVELFFLDERSFRSAKAAEACINPETGKPDLAPTMPQDKRNTFSALVPSLAQPVSQQCLDAINSSQRTYLGADQLARFKKEIAASSATFKVVINELPIQQAYALPYDRWEGYAAERRNVLEYLKAKVKNVVFLTTDVHATWTNDARLQTLEPGGPVNTGILESSVGPAATASFAREVDEATGREGNGAVIGPAFFKPQPPDGVGMLCSQNNVFSYMEVKVSAKALTLTPKDLNGQLVREPDAQGANNGNPCGPFTVTRKK